MLGIKSKLYSGLMLLGFVFSSWKECLAQGQSKGETSFLGALLAVFILLVLGTGIFFTLKIHSLLKGGELSSAWVFSGIALAILSVSYFIELLISLGVINNYSILTTLIRFFGFFLMVIGLILIKKKLS